METSEFLSQNNKPKVSLGAHLIDFFQTLVVFAAIGSFVYWQIAQPHKVSGSSMYPTFHDSDYIITDKISYKFSSPKRDEVIVFKNPKEKSQDFIKRIIGLPGDTVKIEGGKVYVNGKLLDEPYLSPDLITDPGSFSQEGEEIKVDQPNVYFVLGDNRPRSSDSREWGFVSKDEIIGRVFLRYWPKEAIGYFPPEK